jgi:hypothetical protein
VCFWRCRGQGRQHASQAQHFVAQRRAHPVVAARCGKTFVDDQVDNFEHRGEVITKLLARRQIERYARVMGKPRHRGDDLGGFRAPDHCDRVVVGIGRF